MGDLGNEDRLDQYWSLRDLRRTLEARWTLTDTPERTGGPARYVRVAETGGRIGFITPLTHNFCESCNRVRLTCTGQLYMCLGQDDDADLRAVLRAHPADDAPLVAAIRAAIARKPKGHDFDYSPPDRPRPGRPPHEPHRRLGRSAARAARIALHCDAGVPSAPEIEARRTASWRASEHRAPRREASCNAAARPITGAPGSTPLRSSRASTGRRRSAPRTSSAWRCRHT